MIRNQIITTVLDLDHALGGNARLILGGGLGLYLKQEHLERNGESMLLPRDWMPRPRATEDIDLFQRAEFVADPNQWDRFRKILDGLGFAAVKGREYWKFSREAGGQTVEMDLMVGPYLGLERHIKRKGFRVQAKDAACELDAHATDEALAVERDPMHVPVAGALTSGTAHSCHVLVPRAFPYALMKLFALRDHIEDSSKKRLGSHHALDLFRIVGMLTEEEERIAANLAAEFSQHPKRVEAIGIVDTHLAPHDGPGRILLRENPTLPSAADVDRFVVEIRRLLTPRQ